MPTRGSLCGCATGRLRAPLGLPAKKNAATEGQVHHFSAAAVGPCPGNITSETSAWPECKRWRCADSWHSLAQPWSSPQCKQSPSSSSWPCGWGQQPQALENPPKCLQAWMWTSRLSPPPLSRCPWLPSPLSLQQRQPHRQLNYHPAVRHQHLHRAMPADLRSAADGACCQHGLGVRSRGSARQRYSTSLSL